jgi:hypothetical protein
VVLAESLGYYGFVAALFVVVYLLPFYIARRIGKPKGRAWFWYALFLSWLGVLILALLGPKKWAASTVGSEYHVPPVQIRGRQPHWIYDQR